MTLSPGNQRDGGPEEYYESCPFHLPEGAAVRHIAWDAEVPAKTWVKAQLRVAQDKDALENASWLGPEGPGGWFESPQAVTSRARASRWIQ